MASLTEEPASPRPMERLTVSLCHAAKHKGRLVCFWAIVQLENTCPSIFNGQSWRNLELTRRRLSCARRCRQLNWSGEGRGLLSIQTQRSADFTALGKIEDLNITVQAGSTKNLMRQCFGQWGAAIIVARNSILVKIYRKARSGNGKSSHYLCVVLLIAV